jgi:outer membrane protein TolC
MNLNNLKLISIIFFSTSIYSKQFSWDDCVTEVSKSNAELISAQNSLQSSLYLENSAKSGFFPQVNASYNYTYGTSAINADARKNNSLSLNATENIFSGFSDLSKIEQAKFNRISSEESLKAIKAKLSYDLKSSFTSLIFAEQSIKLSQDILKRREANLRLVQLRFESGRENIGSLNLSKAYLAQAKYDLVVAKNSLNVSKANLAKVMSLDDDEDLQIIGNVPLKESMSEGINFKTLASLSPTFKKSEAEEASLKATLDLSKSTFYPSLNLNQSISKSGQELSSASKYWSVGASLTFPLFSGGKDYYSYKSSSENYRAQVMNKFNVQKTTISKLKDTFASFIEAVQKLEVDNAFVVAALSRDRIATAQYNNGLISFTDWDSIENDLIARQKSLVISQRERVIAEAAFEEAQGIGVIP